MELKTLKDLRYLKADKNLLPVYEFDGDVLKAEAVKWVKDNMKEREKWTFEDRAEYTGLIDGFMQFFNLTEEDLG